MSVKITPHMGKYRWRVFTYETQVASGIEETDHEARRGAVEAKRRYVSEVETSKRSLPFAWA